MWRTASPLVPGLGRAHHHHTHTTEALAAGVSERPAKRKPHQGIPISSYTKAEHTAHATTRTCALGTTRESASMPKTP
jgi:hypothetical protein